MIDLTPILEALIGLLATIITVKVVPWLKMKLTNEQQTMLRATVRTLVYAAEQLYGAGNGDLKLEYVQDRLREKNLVVDRAEIEAAIKENIHKISTGEAKE